MFENRIAVIYLGPCPEAFQKLAENLSESSNVQFIHAADQEELLRNLEEHPHGVVIIQSMQNAQVHQAVKALFPPAIVVGIVRDRAQGEALVNTGVFDFVTLSDPGCRLLLTIRNAIHLSRLLKLNSALSVEALQAERMLVTAAGGAGLVHEAKNRLAAIRWSLQLGCEKAENPEKLKWVRSCAKRLESIGVLLGQALSTRPESLIRKTPGVQLDEIANQVVNLIAPSFETAQVTLEQYVQAEIPSLYASPTGIARLLLELLTNSLKACSPGDTVRLKVVKNGKDVVLEVSESGPNHPAFPRQKNKAASEGIGSGVGLALAELVAQAHNSRIEIERKPGTGTIFRVRIGPPDAH